MRSAVVDDRLEAIAGAPMATINGANQTVPMDPANPGAGRALYLVYDVIDLSTQWNYLASIGTPLNNGISVDVNAADAIRCRVDMPGGSVNTSSTDAGARTPGSHVISAVIEPGLTASSIRVDGRTRVDSAALEPGTPVFNQLKSPRVSQSGTLMFAAGYSTAHTEAQRLLVMGWLARRFSLSLSLSPLSSATARRSDWTLAA